MRRRSRSRGESRESLLSRKSFLGTALGTVLAMPSIADAAPSTPGGPPLIRPGEVWPDDRGQHIQAHGGGILHYKGAYYWFGEYRGQDLAPGHRAVSCYRSADLVHWTFKGLPMNVRTLDDLGD